MSIAVIAKGCLTTRNEHEEHVIIAFWSAVPFKESYLMVLIS